jgi:hypothetical protein
VYSDWTADYGLSGDDVLIDADSIDHDGFENLLEFALGMNLTMADVGSRTWYWTETDGETDCFVYVYHRRSDSRELGLSYTLVESPDLVIPITHLKPPFQ